MNFREELIQVAAVAVSIIEDLDYGEANAQSTDCNPFIAGRTDLILSDVLEERYRQDKKWGSKHLNTVTWLMILMEEVGEAAEEELKNQGKNSIIEAMIEVGNRAQWWLEDRKLA